MTCLATLRLTFSLDRTKRKQTSNSVNLADLLTLPKPTQLLLAHFMELSNPNLLLRDGDTDMVRLLGTGWLQPTPCAQAGFASFVIDQQCWRQLMALRPRILTYKLIYELETFRASKTSSYPWVW